jgi:ligand-binding SRPBCC domain-containing protein
MKNTTMQFSTLLNASAKEVFEFHLNFENAIRITPSLFKFRIVTSPAILEEGSNLTIEIRQCGIWFPWDVQIIKLIPHSLMIDMQSGRGPFIFWRHEHHFIQENTSCLMIDKIEYSLPLGIIGRIIDRIIMRFFQQWVFSYRHSKMKSLFP